MREITKMHEKFTEFYEKYEAFMYHIAYGVLKERYAAEDAVQTAFLNLYINFEGIDEIESKRTRHFVATVTKRAAIDIYRQRKRQNARELPYEDYKESTEQQVKIMVEPGEVMECVERISKKQANMLLFKYVHEYTTKEIAKIFGVAQGTVSSQISKGKKQLLGELIKKGIHIPE